MGLLARVAPQPRLGLPWPALLAGLVATAALPFLLGAVGAFRRAGTTVDPRDPSRSAVLVTGGVYRWTRNPMYLAMGLLLAAAAIGLDRLAAVPVVPLYLLWLDRGQIRREEEALALRFGAAYRDYCRRTRRWFGPQRPT